MENRTRREIVCVRLPWLDIEVPGLLHDGEAHEDRDRYLFHFRKIHRRTDATGERAARMFLTALFGRAAIMIHTARNHRGTRQARASEKHENQKQGNENGSGRVV